MEEDFLKNIKKHLFKPIILVVYDIPKLLVRSTIYFELKLFNILILILFVYLIFSNYKIKSRDNLKDEYSKYILFFAIVISSISVFLVYLLVTSVPQVNGYYNRGLVALFICFCLVLGYLNDVKFKNKFINNFKYILIILVTILNFNSFLIQQGNHIEAENERQILLGKVKNFYDIEKTKNTSKVFKPIIFMIIDTYLDHNYNDEVIFSEEVEDLYFAVNFTTDQNVLAKRIYEDKKCKNIININNNRIVGLVTSKNRKYNEKQIANFYEYLNMDRDLYIYFKNKFVKLTYDNEKNYKILKNYLKCQI